MKQLALIGVSVALLGGTSCYGPEEQVDYKVVTGAGLPEALAARGTNTTDVLVSVATDDGWRLAGSIRPGPVVLPELLGDDRCVRIRLEIRDTREVISNLAEPVCWEDPDEPFVFTPEMLLPD